MEFQAHDPDALPQVIPDSNDSTSDTLFETDPNGQSEVDPHNTPTENEPEVIAVNDVDAFEDEGVGGVGGVSARSSMLSMMTLSFSVCDFPSENGRTYHALNTGKYLLPNDETEKDRLDFQHHLFKITFDEELYLAPIKSQPQNVLDIGTGTGIWAIEFGEKYPSAVVLGIDLSPIQPEWVPPNVQFIVDDAEETWPYKQKFDFIHGRMLFTCFTRPKQVIQSAFNCLENGCYLELQDAILPFQSDDGSLEGTHLERWTILLLEGAQNLGKDWTCASKYATYMAEVGFIDVQEVTTKWPINIWPTNRQQKELGMWFHENLVDGLEGFSMKTLIGSGLMTREELDLLLIGVRSDLGNRNIHAYMKVISVYGRKPLSREE